MIEARYHDRVNVLQELFSKSPSGEATCGALAPFDRAEWYSMLAETGLVPLIAIASDAENTAALALTQNKGHISPLRNWYSFTWRQLATDCANGERLLTEIARQLKGRSHRVTLEPVPDEDGSATRLATAFGKAGWRVEVTQCDINHILHVNGQDFAAYWADRPGALRSTLKRKAKKVRTQILTHFDEALWAEYETIYAGSWKPTEDHPSMLRKFAKEEGEAGRLRFGIAWHGERAVAAQCWTVENSVAYIHKLAYLDAARKLSAGTTLSAALFKHVIDTDGVSLVDFGTGDQSYKADWMNAVRPRYRIDCLDMGSPRAWINLSRLAIARLSADEAPELAPFPLSV